MPGKALFLNPPIRVGTDFIDYPWFADYGVRAAAALVRRAGWAVDIVDAFDLPGSARTRSGDGWRLGVSEAEFLAALPADAPDLVVLGTGVFSHPEAPDRRLARILRAARRRWPAATIVAADCLVAGMHYVAYDGAALLAALPDADAIVRYTGERAFTDPARLVGLRGARVVLDDPLAPDGPAEPLPVPDAPGPRYGAFLASCFADSRWFNGFAIDAATRPLVASLGCPYRCTFCSNGAGLPPTAPRTYRVVPVAAVESWAVAARDAGIRKVVFLDSAANVRNDFRALVDALDRLDLDFEFPNGLRADHLEDAAIRAMRGRVTLLSVSVESGSQDDLAGPIGKRLDLADVERVAATCAAAGVPLMLHFVVGFPWETRAHVKRTMALAWSLFERHGALPAVQFATPMPGTALHAQCVRGGLIGPDGPDMRDLGLFQHRPAFVPPGIDGRVLEQAVAAFRQAVAARTGR